MNFEKSRPGISGDSCLYKIKSYLCVSNMKVYDEC